MCKNIKHKNSILILSLLLTLTLSSCSSKNTDKISIAGSSTVLPVVATAADKYREKHPDVKLIVNAGGSGVGISQLGQGQIDIGMMSRDIHSSEIDRFHDATFNVHKIARDAVVVVVSSEIYDAGITELSKQDIAAIYTGDISNWSELGGPDREIFVIDKEASRGTRQVFMNYVLGNKDAIAKGADIVLGSNNEEQTALVQSDAAIGMLSLAWLNEDVKGLSLKISEDESVEPTLENVRNGLFPIVRDLIVVTKEDVSQEALNFIHFLQTPTGQEIVSQSGYIALGGAPN